jgi:hypothetical protein
MKSSGNILRADCVRARALRQGRRHAVTFRPNAARLMAARTEGTMLISRMFTRTALVAVASIALSGCFDLTQSVALDRHGAGRYQVSIAASGMIGEALKSGKSDLDVGQNKNVQTSTLIANGTTTRTSKVDFASLSDLSLAAETISLTVTGHDLLGLGPTHAVFRRNFHVSDAKKRQGEDSANDATAQSMMTSIFGNHFYQFSVTLPGSIDWIAPVRVNGVQIKPTVTGDFYNGHTITWRMPLIDLFQTQDVGFSVGFSAIGSFADAQTRASHKHDI